MFGLEDEMHFELEQLQKQIDKFKKVHVCSDESGHWYVIPFEMKKEFSQMQEEIKEDSLDLYEEFNEKFSKYRTGGDLNNIQLYTKI